MKSCKHEALTRTILFHCWNQLGLYGHSFGAKYANVWIFAVFPTGKQPLQGGKIWLQLLLTAFVKNLLITLYHNPETH